MHREDHEVREDEKKTARDTGGLACYRYQERWFLLDREILDPKTFFVTFVPFVVRNMG